MKQIRNIAIIAHVDHGKTTLVDQLLRQSGTFRANQQVDERVMDSNDIEKERGITILAKNTAIDYEGYHINIVDTPGHADFGGEVERVLGMVDCVVLLVDAQEGPMPQTRFVTKKALALGLKPIVVINKIDKPSARPSWVIDQTFELFDNLGATDEQLDFPIVYASGLSGFAKLEETDESNDMRPLFDTILKHTPAPSGSADETLQLQISQLDYDNYTGRLGIGRILNGRIKPGQVVAVMNHEQQIAQGRINQLLGFKGLERIPLEEAEAGDIVIISGIEGYELAVGKPRVVYRDIDGQKCEPYENLTVDVPDDNQGAVMEELGRRRGELTNMESDGNGRTRLEYHIPARGLIGFQGEFMTLTRGVGLMSHVFDDYAPVKPDMPGRHNGVLVSQEQGEAVAYALWNVEDRGRMFVSPNDKIYEGMIIGIHSRENDLVVNPLKGKKLTNVRASGTDEAVRLTTPIKLTLEGAVEFIDDDELVEITPQSIRLRKRYLSELERRRHFKKLD